MRRDPGRLVIAASGWTDFEVSLRTITESVTNLVLTSRWVTSEMCMFTQGRKMLMEQQSGELDQFLQQLLRTIGTIGTIDTFDTIGTIGRSTTRAVVVGEMWGKVSRA